MVLTIEFMLVACRAGAASRLRPILGAMPSTCGKNTVFENGRSGEICDDYTPEN